MDILTQDVVRRKVSTYMDPFGISVVAGLLTPRLEDCKLSDSFASPGFSTSCTKITYYQSRGDYSAITFYEKTQYGILTAQPTIN